MRIGFLRWSGIQLKRSSIPKRFRPPSPQMRYVAADAPVLGVRSSAPSPILMMGYSGTMKTTAAPDA